MQGKDRFFGQENAYLQMRRWSILLFCFSMTGRRAKFDEAVEVGAIYRLVGLPEMREKIRKCGGREREGKLVLLTF